MTTIGVVGLLRTATHVNCLDYADLHDVVQPGWRDERDWRPNETHRCHDARARQRDSQQGKRHHLHQDKEQERCT
jgi:hypothetical protein